MSMVQDGKVGDGTTSATVLAAELLHEAEKLVEQKIHPHYYCWMEKGNTDST